MNNQTIDYKFAGFWLRVIAGIIDTLILWIPASLFNWLFKESFSNEILFQVYDFIQLTIIWSLYYGFLESSTYQGTLGKRLLGLKAVDINGNRISFVRAVSRFLLGIIASFPLGIGIFMIGFTKKKQGLHDILAKCLVVKK